MYKRQTLNSPKAGFQEAFPAGPLLNPPRFSAIIARTSAIVPKVRAAIPGFGDSKATETMKTY